jgi:Ser/Thr protein kinase RdoA (MazF antagonist)
MKKIILDREETILQKLEQHVKYIYGLKNPQFQLIYNYRNAIYLVGSDTAKYVFKVYSGKSQLASIKDEIKVLNILNDRSVPVSYPLKALRNDQIVKVFQEASVNYGVLFTYAIGESHLILSPNQLHVTGKELGNMHNILLPMKVNNIKVRYTISSMMVDSLKIIKPSFIGLENDYKYIYQLALKVIDKLKKLHIKTFNVGLCHGDLTPNNLHFDIDDNLTFFDFDVMGYGYQVMDIVSLYMYFFVKLLTMEMSFEEASRSMDILLKGYKSERKLSDNELDAIPYLCLGYMIYGLRFNLENFGGWTYPEYLIDRIKWIKVWKLWCID